MAGNPSSEWSVRSIPTIKGWVKQRTRVYAKAKSLMRYFYSRVQHTICALSPYAALPALSPIEIERVTDFTANLALRQVIEESHPWNQGEMDRRQRLGDACYLVFMGERCVHYSWATQHYRNITEIGFDATLRKNDVWIYDCYTTPEYRGHAIYPKVLVRILQDAREHERETVWIDVQTTNASSIRGMLKAGFLAVAHLEKSTFLKRFVLSRQTKLMSLTLGDLFEEMPSRFE